MTLTYTRGIPATNNNPSNDQPNLLDNTNSVDDIISVDHYSFADTPSGDHKQITFGGNNVPSLPATPPILFSNLVGGLAQLFFYSGDAAHSSTQYVASANGSTFLLGGVILKWGVVISAGASTPQTFTSAFPNNCFIVLTKGQNSAGNNLTISGVTPSGFTLTSSSSCSYYYLAIGN